MNLQQMYDKLLLKNNLSASQKMYTLNISWGRVMNLQQMYDILLKNNLSASQKHVYFIYFWRLHEIYILLK